MMLCIEVKYASEELTYQRLDCHPGDDAHSCVREGKACKKADVCCASTFPQDENLDEDEGFIKFSENLFMLSFAQKKYIALTIC